MVSGSKQENIILLRNEGKSFNEIHRLLNCSKGYISTICEKYNLSDIGLSDNKKLTDAEIIELKEFYKTHTKKETSEKFGVSGTTVTKYKECKRVLLNEDEKVTNYESLKSFRKKNKKRAVEYKGGRCLVCSYNKCITALEFHHLDPMQKDFTISKNCNKAWHKIEKELEKCILVCANCHREIHDGLIVIDMIDNNMVFTN